MAHEVLVVLETSNQDSIPCGESSLEQVYGSSPLQKETHISDDLVPDEIYLMVADWNTPSISKVGEQDSTNDRTSAALSNINFDPIRRMLISAHQPTPSKFFRSIKKSKTS